MGRVRSRRLSGGRWGALLAADALRNLRSVPAGGTVAAVGAEVQGISEGDVILDVGGRAVSTPADVAAGIKAARDDGKKAVLMRVKSGKGQTRFVAVSLSKNAG